MKNVKDVVLLTVTCVMNLVETIVVQNTEDAAVIVVKVFGRGVRVLYLTKVLKFRHLNRINFNFS